ncbi:MAG TPA: fructose-bisphosphate aldolase [Caldisericia bacterium]|nr:fructose-bisphosphate aldolase [Caldisericia bacterium]
MDFSTLSSGKLVRMARMAFEHGPGDGKLLILPIDQGVEHGPVDFLSNPDSANPKYQFEMALRGDYSAIAVHIGLAVKYHSEFAGLVPLVLKINGKTNIPSDENAFSPLTATVEDAVRLGADAVGYTLYAGSPRQDDDIEQLCHVRTECDRFGMPLIVWSYPRGAAVEKKGGKDSLYAIDYAARLALELGADVIKLNYPKLVYGKGEPEKYTNLETDEIKAMERLVISAGNAGVIVSGGSKISDEQLLDKVSNSLRAGVMGLIFGRNMWQRPMEEALELTEKIHQKINEASGVTG